MEIWQELQDYFDNRLKENPEEFEIGAWSRKEGLIWLKAPCLPEVIQHIWVDGGPRPMLMTHVGNDERSLGNGFVLYLLFHFPGDFVLTLGARGIQESFPSLTILCPALNWAEREVRDLFGIIPEGHPDPRPLVLHPGWQAGFYPLRRAETKTGENNNLELNLDKIQNGFSPEPLVFTAAQGEGTFEIPVGPIHAGIIEPGHFRFQTIGEKILHLEAQLFYTHKGVEKLLEGKTIEEGLKIVERICGVCTVSHALAYCEAVEKLKGIKISREALRWRTVLAELERLYNHVGDIGNICAGVGFALGNSNALQNKEQLQRLNQEFFGHRFLRGTVTLAGVKGDLEQEKEESMAAQLKSLRENFEEWISLILEHDGFRQRAINTGVLKKESALDLGVTGPAARASGIPQDWRERHEYLLYPELKVKAQVEEGGDVWARLMVRVHEVRQGYTLLEKLLSMTSSVSLEPSDRFGSSAKSIPSPIGLSSEGFQPYSFAWGCAESPRGTDVIWLMLDAEEKIYRCRIRSAAYANWPAVPLAVLGNIVPDFPLINKSFELCYSCCDR